MDGGFREELTEEGTGATTPSEAWLFAQALLGKSLPNPAAAEAENRAKREQLEWLATFSPRHKQQLNRLLSQEAEARRQREQLEWLAGISPRHEQQLRSLLASEAAARDAQRRVTRFSKSSQTQEAQWDPSKHPRGAFSQNRGWWSPTDGPSGAGKAIRGPGRSAGRVDRSATGIGVAPPEMLELAKAWWNTNSLLQKYRADVDELPSRIANEEAQLGSGGRYAYLHPQNLAKAKQDLEAAKALIPQLEAQLSALKQQYHDSGFDEVGYVTWTPGETLTGGRGIEGVGRALDMGGSPAGLQPTDIEFEIATSGASVLELGRTAIKNAIGAPLRRAAALKPYGGPGGGHHVPAKIAFKGAPGYDANAALAIPWEELDRLNIKHAVVTGAQKQLYQQIAKTGAKLTWTEMEAIETQALVRGGLDFETALATVKHAIDALKKAGIAGPTRIPWGK